jgi:hypothetical protein
MHCVRYGQCPLLPHIGRHRQHDVAVPWPGASSRKTSTQRHSESSGLPSHAGSAGGQPRCMNIDGMTLCEREARGERAQSRRSAWRFGHRPCWMVSHRTGCYGRLLARDRDRLRRARDRQDGHRAGRGRPGLAVKRRSPMVTGAQSPGTAQLVGHGRAVGPNRTAGR